MTAQPAGRLPALLVAVSLMAVACGGGETTVQGIPGAPAESTAADSTTAGAAPDALAFLGELVTGVEAPRQSVRFDSAGGDADLGADAKLTVAAGAFAEGTEVTLESHRVDLAAAPGADIWSRAYVVSTVDDVALAAPVTIDIDRPAEQLRAFQLVDGEWTSVAVTGDAGSAAISIPHFSEVVTVVAETAGRPQPGEIPPAQAGQAPAEFLRACIFTVSGFYGAHNTPGDGFTQSDIDFGIDLAYATCVNALIRRSSPAGAAVSTGCVGDRIGVIGDLQAAINSCIANTESDSDDVTADEAAADEPASTQDADPPPAQTDASAEIDDGSSGPASYSVTLAAADLPESQTQVSSLNGFTADADVGPDGAELSVSFEVFVWRRGGESPPPFEDQNCGVTYRGTAFGQGPSGSPTRIVLEITSFDVVGTVGALCRDGDTDFLLQAPGDTGGSFEGQLNGLGFAGTYRLPGSFFQSVDFEA